MQTFLPFADFERSALCLDRQRLGKQRVEVLQIMKAIKQGAGWANHPATVMWRNHTDALMIYGTTICNEWVSRGYKDTCAIKIIEATGYDIDDLLQNLINDKEIIYPPWLGDEELHNSHRVALLCKDWPHYSSFEWPEAQWGKPISYDYFWPNLSTKYGGEGDGHLRK